ncbi:MAG: DUF2157 domain-containing protein [Betaproteobacteria bacterium]|nr:MAG: DUF2157 domain-containing protein [Betaproteobacteria bacterium]
MVDTTNPWYRRLILKRQMFVVLHPRAYTGFMNSTTPEPPPDTAPRAASNSIIQHAEDVIADPSLLRALTHQTTLSAAAIDRARELIGSAPSASDWQKALTRIGSVGAGACASAAVVCFIAFNWDALGRWFRFALFESALVFAVLVAVICAHKPLIHKAASIFVLFALGGLLAFTGQTYQTGADTYQLFVVWAALALPWIFAARWWGYTLLWFLVVQIALTLWANHAPWVRDTLQATTVFTGAIIANVLFAICFYVAQRFEAFNHRWLWRIALLAALTWSSFCSFTGSDLLAFERADRAFSVTRFDAIAALVIAGSFFVCSRIGRGYFDATVLYAAWTCGLIVAMRWVLSAVDYAWRDSGALFFLSAALLAGGVTMGAVLIRSLSRQHSTRALPQGTNL